jgi:bacterioferritin
MMITHENLIRLLNMDLELEMTVVMRYINHAAMLTGDAYRTIKNTLNAFAWQEIEHAMILAEQIWYLGGYPNMRASFVYTSEDNEEMLWYDFEDKEDAIQRYTMRIEQAEQLEELELSKRLRSILRVEQQHVVYLRKQVCAREKQGDGSNLPTFDACDFSHIWAERAAKVPIRIKKTDIATR